MYTILCEATLKIKIFLFNIDANCYFKWIYFWERKKVRGTDFRITFFKYWTVQLNIQFLFLNYSDEIIINHVLTRLTSFQFFLKLSNVNSLDLTASRPHLDNPEPPNISPYFCKKPSF